MQSASRTFHRGVVSVLSAVAFVVPAQPAGAGEPELLGQAETGVLGAIATSDDHAYIAGGFSPNSGLVVVDVSVPDNPEIRGSAAPDGAFSFKDIAVAGDFAYVADTSFGLRVFDVSNPAMPMEIASFRMSAGGIAISDDIAYVIGGGTLRRFDVSSPDTPTELGDAFATPSASAVVVQENVAYVATGSGLQLIDVTDPATPAPLGFYEAPPSFFAFDVAVANDLAYVIGGSGGFLVIDVSDASRPMFRGSLDFRCCSQEVAVSGRRVYVAVNSGDLQEALHRPERDAPTSTNVQDVGLRIIDVSDPARPMEEGFFSASDAFAVALDGDLIYLGDVNNFSVLDAAQGEPDCPGDVNGDGRVGILDLLTVISDFGCAGDCDGDTNGDDVVDFSDLLAVVGNYGCGFCETSADCDDGDPCTIDLCVGSACVNIPIPGCGW